jgi:surfeit locus 1 family protein
MRSRGGRQECVVRPRITGWGVTAVLLALVVAAVCIRLGFWQLDRLADRQALNAELAASLAEEPVRLPGAAGSVRGAPQDFLYRRATVRGRFLPERTVLLRGRFHAGQPGVHVVTPMELAGGEILLVNRGWVPAPDGATVDSVPAPTPGETTVSGTLEAVPHTGDGGRPSPPEAGPGTGGTFQRLDLETLAAHLPRLLPLYLQQAAVGEADGLPRPVPPPELSDGPHLGYAIQWFSFAAIALIGLAVVLLRRRRPTAGGSVPAAEDEGGVGAPEAEGVGDRDRDR